MRIVADKLNNNHDDVTDFLEAEDRECDAFCCKIDETEDETPIWIGCDCNRWFHLYCVDLLELDDDFVCNFCSY